jgi:NADH-quinone oxidoreductase subunit L
MELLWLIPALPYTGALLLMLLGPGISKGTIAKIGAGSIGLSALLTFIAGFDFLSSGQSSFQQSLWQWMDVGQLNPAVALHLDALSLVFLFVITFVGFLIHVYSAEFMREDEGYARFFIFMNLFVGSMLMLVLADNLVLMFFGWEGVGLCSYLLIGFWYKEEKNGYAARKAFIITRVGDTALAIGLFMLFQALGTLDIQEILLKAPQMWTVGSNTAVVIALLLLGGAVGKSAQLPLQTWLPDAMAGPSPVSALIHAATMVTAGVYLIARTHVIFELAPVAQTMVATIGSLTLLVAGFTALTQHDLKRILAYSTISQIGYMFLALGIGAWSAAIFHFMIHAFFKALLFLAAGTVIALLHHEHNIFKMGGLRHKMPVVYWTFLIGAGSLAAIPLITAGFYSKDQILWLALAGERGNTWLFASALFGAFITALYTFRMVFVTFFGTEKTHVGHHAGKLMTIPLVVLAILSLLGGFIELPHTLGHLELFTNFLKPVLPIIQIDERIVDKEWIVQLSATVLSLAGIYVAYLFYIRRPDLLPSVRSAFNDLYVFWFSGWGFDRFYNAVFVYPLVKIAAINKNDIMDKLADGLVASTNYFHRLFAWTQSGIMRWYMMGIVIGTIMAVTITLLINT